MPGPGARAPHRGCRCCPSSRAGRRSGRCRRCRSRCRRCCRCRRRTGTRLRTQDCSAGVPRRERGPQGRAGQALTRVAGLALPAVVARAVEVVDQVVAAAAAVAGIGEAVVGIWGRGRRSTGGHRHSGRAAWGRGPGAGGRDRGGKDARPRPELLVGPGCVGSPTHSAGPGAGEGTGQPGGPLTGVAELALPAAGAEAAEGGHLVDARAPVAAGLAQAVVDVYGRLV